VDGEAVIGVPDDDEQRASKSPASMANLDDIAHDLAARE
jgi:hypothetical protein